MSAACPAREFGSPTPSVNAQRGMELTRSFAHGFALRGWLAGKDFPTQRKTSSAQTVSEAAPRGPTKEKSCVSNGFGSWVLRSEGGIGIAYESDGKGRLCSTERHSCVWC